MFVVRRRGARSLDRIQHEMEDAFHEMVGVGTPLRVRLVTGDVPAWRPAIEVYETAEALVVVAEVAGLSDDQIEVVVDEQVMTIRGHRTVVGCDERRIVHAMGISYGPFAVDVFLPFAVNHDAIEAMYDAGMLRVTLPRAAATRIQIGNGEGA